MRSGGGSQPWERYEGEGDERWQAFVVYRDQPSESEERSLREVGRQLGKSRALVERWSSEDGWPRRVASYDMHLDAQKRAALSRELESTVRAEAQHLAAARTMIGQTVTAVLRDIGRANDEGEDPFEGWDLREKLRAATVLAKALPAIVQAERLVAGLSTTNVGGHDGSSIKAEIEEVERMDRGQLEAYLLGREEQR